MMHASDPSRLTATDAARLIRDGQLRPDGADGSLPGADRRSANRACTPSRTSIPTPQQAAAAAPPGPLHGLPIGVKDVLDTADMPSEYGSPIWRGWRPRADAAAVAWARAAGGVVIGKTVTTEFATRKPGPTANPHNPDHTPGGVEQRLGRRRGGWLLPAGLRHPDRRQRDPPGRLLRRGRLQAELRDDQPLRHEAHVGQPRYGWRHGPQRRRLRAVRRRRVRPRPGRSGCARPDARRASASAARRPGTRPRRRPAALLSRVAAALGRAGAAVSDRELPAAFAALVEAHPIVMNSESARALGWELATAREQISEGLRERLEFGLSQTEAALGRGLRRVRATPARRFRRPWRGWTCWSRPRRPARRRKGWNGPAIPAFNFIWTSLHVPCVTVPAGTGPDGAAARHPDRRPRRRGPEALAWAQWVAAALR